MLEAYQFCHSCYDDTRETLLIGALKATHSAQTLQYFWSNAIWTTICNLLTYRKYLLTWLIAAGWIDGSCIIYLRWLYKYCILTEGCLKLDSVCCPWRRTVWQFHFLYFMFRLCYDRFSPWWFWEVDLPCFFLHECFTRLKSQHCWLSYMLQLLYFYCV